MDRIQAVRLFIRVVDMGSFSKAAADMGVGQPAATKMVALLEKKLGSRLLHRSTHGVTPTEIGALYYEKCKLIAHHVEEAETVAALMQTQVQGGLRITTSVAFGRRVLGPMVMRFMQLHPKLQVELNFEDQADLVDPVDVDNFPTLLIASPNAVRFFGTLTPHIETLRRLIQTHGAPDAAHAPVDAAVSDLAERLRQHAA